MKDLKVTDCKLIKAGGMTLLGVAKKCEEGDSISLRGIECLQMPTEDDFKGLFKALVTDTCVKSTITNATDVVYLELGLEAQIHFASVLARFTIIQANQDKILAGMAINSLL